MKKGLTMGVLFWVLIFFIVLIVFVSLALWSKGFGLNILSALLGSVP